MNDYENIPKEEAVLILMQLMKRAQNVKEVEALALAINNIVRRSRHQARNRVRRRELTNEVVKILD